jgi:hypothetical protein
VDLRRIPWSKSPGGGEIFVARGFNPGKKRRPSPGALRNKP